LLRQPWPARRNCANSHSKADRSGIAAGKALALIRRVTHYKSVLSGVTAAVLLLVGCASGPRARPSPESRVKDSAPEKIAAQRSATPGLQLEDEDQRWGIEAARARRQEADGKKQIRDAALLPSGPVDLTRPPSSPR
jgi:hypothetical protein